MRQRRPRQRREAASDSPPRRRSALPLPPRAPRSLLASCRASAGRPTARRSSARIGACAGRCRSCASRAPGCARPSSAPRSDTSRSRNVPFIVSNTMIGPAPGERRGAAAGAGVVGAGFAPGARFRSGCPEPTQFPPPPPTNRTTADTIAMTRFIRHPLIRPICRQSRAMAQSPQRGRTGRQTFCPHVTRYRLMTGHHRASVSPGKAPARSPPASAVRTQPRRFEMRWTWCPRRCCAGS